jgi:hypothetical protein
MHLKKIQACILFFIIAFTSHLYSEELHGKLLRFSRFGLTPAAYQPLVLLSKNNRTTIQEESDSNGTFFIKCGPGRYTLQIGHGKERPLEFSVIIQPKQAVRLRPIVIHSLSIKPTRNLMFRIGDQTYLSGTFRSLPEDIPVWIVLRKGNEFFPAGKIHRHSGDRWYLKPLIIKSPADEICAVMITQELEKRFMYHAKRPHLTPFNLLKVSPGRIHFLDRIKISVH